MYVHAGTIQKKVRDLVNFGRIKIKKLPVSGLASPAEVNTGFVLPDNAVVLDLFLKVNTAVSGKAIDIGTDGSGSNDPDGFADALSVATTGIKRPGAALDGGSAYFDSNTRGVLLSDFVQGAGADDRGLYREKPDLTSGGESVTYTPEAATTDLEADLYIVFIDLDENNYD